MVTIEIRDDQDRAELEGLLATDEEAAAEEFYAVVEDGIQRFNEGNPCEGCPAYQDVGDDTAHWTCLVESQAQFDAVCQL